MNLNDDKTRAVLSLSGSYTATQLEKFITELIVLRAQMKPPVPYDPPTRSTPADVMVSHQSDPYVGFRRLRDGALRFWLRNAGLGWMVFDLPARKAEALRDWLVASKGKEGVADFFTRNRGEGEKPH